MRILRRSACARAGLFGNPSDGYFGKTISVAVPNFEATVVCYEWEDVEVVQTKMDRGRFDSIQDLVRDVELHGYYGGVRLLKATIKKFVEYCEKYWPDELHKDNFSLRYESTIPQQVGLAGSSAIIVAALRCLMDFYQVTIPPEIQPSLALAVESEELGITAGLQDRVIQVYEGLVYMDFAKEQMERSKKKTGYECGSYERLDPALLPPLYLAFKDSAGEPTERFHNDLRGRYDRGDPDVVSAMETFADLAAQARAALLAGDGDKLSHLIDKNFDTRRSICRLPTGQIEMVEAARDAGASGKFAGSGGAIVGTYRDEETFANLERTLSEIGCQVVKLNCLSHAGR